LFYDGRLQSAASTSEREAIAAGPPYPGNALIVVDTAGRTRCQRSERGSSRVNVGAARLSCELALEARRGDRSVVVVTPYTAQAAAIRDQLASRRRNHGVECSTIHRFQGQERDVVIIDLVDGEPMRPGRLLDDDRAVSPASQILNVSISRALGKLIIVADVGYFAARAPRAVVTQLLTQACQRGVRIVRDPIA